MGSASVHGHTQTRTLTESIWYPEHDPRKASAEYKRVHHHLVYELDTPCWICGVRQSQMPDGEHMETHHWHVEWALEHRIDPAKIIADFPMDNLQEWLDSEGNMLVLCSDHHRHGLIGIHSITYPAWVAQRWLKNGHDIAKP
jgi:hypothetical protein